MKDHHIFELLIKTLSAIPSIVGNSLVIHSVRKFHYLQSITYMFITSLALADLIIGISNVLDSTLEVIVTYSHNQTFAGYGVVCKCMMLIVISGGGADCIGITGITMERFIYINFPMNYPYILSSGRTIAIIVSMWSFMVLANLIGIILSNKSIGPGTMCQHDTVFDMKMNTFVWMPGILVAITSVFVLYAKIAQVACKASKEVRKVHVAPSEAMGTKQDAQSTPKESSQKKITKTLLMVSTVYVITYIPLIAVNTKLAANPSSTVLWVAAAARGMLIKFIS